ncbi:MAG: hypothetical protein QJR12_16755 [Mycobacterium sp.]|uniref:hypothetical protein n=1 Tax=Mycobacterium sp. TaxID=1785 RepID=UPI00262156E5|nr:hypothetical protein [Mycobacterium sp.]MDI3315857.1 hypothetical protein [Mycobacterium sp.]
MSSAPQVVADAPKVMGAIDSQFDATIDGNAVKIASMLDEHTRESLLNIVERPVRLRRWTAAGAAHGQRPGDDFASVATVL